MDKVAILAECLNIINFITDEKNNDVKKRLYRLLSYLLSLETQTSCSLSRSK